MFAAVQASEAAGLPAASALAGGGSLHVYDPDSACAALLGRKWALQIVAVLLSGRHRFSTIHSAIPGLGDKVLSRRLGELEAAGILTREQYLEIPLRVEYALTETGLALEPVIAAMERWNREHGAEVTR